MPDLPVTAAGDTILPGETYLADTPVLRAHAGTQPDLFLRWNAIPLAAESGRCRRASARVLAAGRRDAAGREGGAQRPRPRRPHAADPGAVAARQLDPPHLVRFPGPAGRAGSTRWSSMPGMRFATRRGCGSTA